MPDQYVAFKGNSETNSDFESIQVFLDDFSLSGIEVYMDDILSRDKILFTSEKDKQALICRLKEFHVKRVHCSYWAYPTSFLVCNNFKELIERFRGEHAVQSYYGDLTGSHIFQRWVHEYTLAKELCAKSYVFHLIDYAPIDGLWAFSISRKDIRQAMIFMLQKFLNLLIQNGVVTPDSPIIEVENSGWGLEHGIQTAEDYMQLFGQLYDPYNKVKIGWDLNHLLHAVGFDEDNGKTMFFLPDEEITPEMKLLQAEYSDSAQLFTQKWVEYNVLFPRLINNISAIHLSDCGLKKKCYFTNGKLNGDEYSNICLLKTWDDREQYGVEIVLTHYDSHLVLGKGVLCPNKIKEMLQYLKKQNSDFVILHELKNSTDLYNDLKIQITSLDF